MLDEMIHIQEWATENNLRLHSMKTKQILFQVNVYPGNDVQFPPPCHRWLDFNRDKSPIGLNLSSSTTKLSREGELLPLN